MKKRTISGSAVALVTPFKRDESIDETALRRLVQFHIEGGTGHHHSLWYNGRIARAFCR
jgi:dihydrodipicolinate synthase/N-acetylneuraminate lyase